LGNKSKGIPVARSMKEVQLEHRIKAMLEMTVTYADALDEARKKLINTGRVQQKDPRITTIGLQLKTLEEVINNCLFLQPDELEGIRAGRDQARYEAHVEKLMDIISPILIITPPGFRVR